MVEVPEDLDPAEVVSLLFPYMTSYQALHRTARVQPGESVLVHGAAGRVGVAALECGAQVGLHMYGTCSGRDFATVEKLGAVPIDYRNEDFVARIRRLTGGKGVDVVLDSLGGPISLRSFRVLRPGRQACRVRPLRHALARAQELAGGDRVVRLDRGPVAVGEAVAAPAGDALPDPKVPRSGAMATRSGGWGTPLPGVVPCGLRHAARTAARREDPPARGGAPAAHRSASRARVARDVGIEGETGPRAIGR